MPFASAKQRRFLYAKHPAMARRWSAEEKAMSKSLVEIRKAQMSREDRKSAATGVGAVGIGAGLAGGGIPGTKATRLSSDFLSGPPKKRLGNFWRARRAGAFGYRVNAHSTLKNFNLSPQGIDYRIPGKGKAADFRRAAEGGKVAPEEKIIRHLKVGRKASHGLLAGGAGLTAYGLANRKKVEKAQDDRNTRGSAWVAGGGAAAGGGYGAARLLEHQGRKWTTSARRNFTEAQKILPEVGGHTVRRGKRKVPSVRAEFGSRKAPVTNEMLRGASPKRIAEGAALHGKATNQAYFGNVYGKMGTLMRRGVVPAGAIAAAGGGAGLYANRRRESVRKAYTPSYFQGSAPTERLHGQRQRTVAEGQRAGLSAAGGALAAGSGAALGARWLGHDAAPALVRAAGVSARNKGVPKETVKDLTQRADRIHTWSHKRRGRLLAASAALAGGSLAARTGARWKKSEVEGISQDLGRASSGDRLQRGSRKFSKGLGTAVVGSYGMKAAKKWGELSPKARENIIRGTLVGTTATTAGGTAAWTANRQNRWHSEKKRLKAAGGVTGPVMKSESATIGKARTNLKDYDYLPENIHSDVGEGSIGIRRNPMSALDLFASSRLMAEADARARGERISRRRLNRRARNEMNYAGGRAMLYSPVGRGSVF